MKRSYIVYDFKLKQGNVYEVAWSEWDGHCMCSRVTKTGEVEYNDPEGLPPDLRDMQKLVGIKYYGDN